MKIGLESKEKLNRIRKALRFGIPLSEIAEEAAVSRENHAGVATGTAGVALSDEGLRRISRNAISGMPPRDEYLHTRSNPYTHTVQTLRIAGRWWNLLQDMLNDISPSEQSSRIDKIISLDVKSLYFNRYEEQSGCTQVSTSAFGISDPRISFPPLKIMVRKYRTAQKDTWEFLAGKHGTTVEIMLRINSIPAETVWKILKDLEIPEKMQLVPGMEIFVPTGKLVYPFTQIP